MKMFHHIFQHVNNGQFAEMKIFIADPRNRNPQSEVENAVQYFVNGRLYNDYVALNGNLLLNRKAVQLWQVRKNLRTLQ